MARQDQRRLKAINPATLRIVSSFDRGQTSCNMSTVMSKLLGSWAPHNAEEVALEVGEALGKRLYLVDQDQTNYKVCKREDTVLPPYGDEPSFGGFQWQTNQKVKWFLTSTLLVPVKVSLPFEVGMNEYGALVPTNAWFARWVSKARTIVKEGHVKDT